jgi:hypothetical protein
MSCKCSASGLLGSLVPICGGVGGRNGCVVEVVGEADEGFG